MIESKPLFKMFLFLISLLLPALSNGDSLNYNCHLISGKLVKIKHNSLFKFTHSKKHAAANYPMTHVQFFIKTANGDTYKVVMDNLFYRYLTLEQASVDKDVGITSDLVTRYKVGADVEACGKVFDNNHKLGIHFVHPSDCATTPFNGFLRINGQNITRQSKYCANCSCKIEH